MAGEKNQLEEEAVLKFWLLTRPPNLGAEASDVVEDYFEEQQQQQQQASAEVAITLASEPECAAVFLSRPKKEHSTPDVTWACAWCLVSRNITQK